VGAMIVRARCPFAGFTLGAALFAAALFAACGDNAVTPDAGAHDGGTTRADAGEDATDGAPRSTPMRYATRESAMRGSTSRCRGSSTSRR